MTLTDNITMNHENTSKSLTNLAPALIAAIAETQDVIADSNNPFHNSKYASLSQHLKTLKPVFAKHGLAIVQMPTTAGFENGIGIKTVILHKSGEYIESTISIEAPLEKGKDKNGNDFERKGYTGQQAGSLLSYLRRYGLAAVAGVATEDDDGETDRASYSGPAPVTNYIPNPTVKAGPAPAAAAPAAGMVAPNAFPIEDVPDIDSVVMPFGKNKGTPLSSLSTRDWEWIVNKMELKPFNGKISAKDIKLKNAARILLERANGGGADSDDVPF